jgi:hypothetical protein
LQLPNPRSANFRLRQNLARQRCDPRLIERKAGGIQTRTVGGNPARTSPSRTPRPASRACVLSHPARFTAFRWIRSKLCEIDPHEISFLSYPPDRQILSES